MRLAACTVAYNEAEWIETCIGQLRGYVNRHLVLVSSQPWYGASERDDGTADLAAAAGAEVHVQHWKSETEQRNWGLEKLRDFDYVLILDADEFFVRSEMRRLLGLLSAYREPCFRCREMRTYWKSSEWVCDPIDSFSPPVIVVDPKAVRFRHFREVSSLASNTSPVAEPILPVTLHHMSWVKSDTKIREKIQTFSHAEWVHTDWFEKVWLNWSPGMEEIAPYGDRTMRAVHSPCPPLDS
ncbi:MAG TPA: hypothetical protein VGL72_25340 [Bryobacteraceae bacterium]|jgi:glycosyltransferase involved in cell wall biosynthesis